MRKLEASGARRVGGWTLVPVELTVIDASHTDRWCHASVTKRPYALILLGSDGVQRALDLDGDEIPISELLAQVPALDKTLKDASTPGT